jgi:3-phenylpropionate/trans-cinnamate dioxygenase ferredoxin reductase subunit
VTRIEGQGNRAAGVETADGRRFAADLVLVAIGIVPNVELAAEAGLPVANGIVVDAHLLTSDPSVSAIGDCALFPMRLRGRRAEPAGIGAERDRRRALRCGPDRRPTRALRGRSLVLE